MDRRSHKNSELSPEPRCFELAAESPVPGGSPMFQKDVPYGFSPGTTEKPPCPAHVPAPGAPGGMDISSELSRTAAFRRGVVFFCEKNRTDTPLRRRNKKNVFFDRIGDFRA